MGQQSFNTNRGYNGYYNNQNNGNQSDQELQSVLVNYNALFNNKDPRNLFRWPVFNPKMSNMPLIDFDNGAHNANPNFNYPDDLAQMWRVSEHHLNPDTQNLKTTVLLGLDTLQRRVGIHKEVSKNTLQKLNSFVTKTADELTKRIENETVNKLKKIRGANSDILGKTLRMERKLFLIAKRLKTANLDLEGKIRVIDIFKGLNKQISILDVRINDLKQMIDGRFYCGYLGEGSQSNIFSNISNNHF